MKVIKLETTPRYNTKIKNWAVNHFAQNRERVRMQSVLEIERHTEETWFEHRGFDDEVPPLLLEIKDKIEKLDKILYSPEILSLAIYSLRTVGVNSECFKTEAEVEARRNFLGFKKILKFEPLLNWKDVFFICLEECVYQSSGISWKQRFEQTLGKGSAIMQNMREYSDAENCLWLKLKEESLA